MALRHAQLGASLCDCSWLYHMAHFVIWLSRPRPRLRDRAGVCLCKCCDSVNNMVETTCLWVWNFTTHNHLDLWADDEDPSQLIIQPGWDAPHVRCFPRVFCAWPCLLGQVGTALGSPNTCVVIGITYANPGSWLELLFRLLLNSLVFSCLSCLESWSVALSCVSWLEVGNWGCYLIIVVTCNSFEVIFE